MRSKRYISLFTAIIIFISVLTAFPMAASANTPAYNKLSTYQQHFLRTMGSFAQADMYKNDILASLKVSQAILESGWGRSVFGTVGKNLFCIKAYSSWNNKVFDNTEGIVYANLTDFRIIKGANFTGSGWRAYDSWIDSSADHTALLRSGKYAELGIPGMFDYKEAAYAVVTAGYTSDYGYSDRLISLIQDYNLTKYDDISPNQYGVIAMEMNYAEKFIGKGSTYKLTASVITNTTVTQQPVWASTNQSVATVSQDGTVTANALGFTLITASIGDREACVIVTVTDNNPDYNASVFETAVTIANLNVRSEANTSSSIIGKILTGITIKLTGPVVSTGGVYDLWYPVTGTAETGATVSGWVSADFLVVGDNLNIRSQPNASAQVLLKLLPGANLDVTGDAMSGWYPVTGENAAGGKVSGWINGNYLNLREAAPAVEVTKVGFNRYELNRDVNVTYQLNYAVGSCYAVDKTLVWTSSDTSVAGVVDGLITTYKYGTATVTATAASGVSASCLVNVTDKPVRYTAKTVATLYVRGGAGESFKSVGIYNSGTIITVIDNYKTTDGLIDDGWHYTEGIARIGTDSDGKYIYEEKTGYSKSDFIVLIAREGEETFSDEFEITDNVISLNDGYIFGVDPTYTAGDLLAYVLNTNAKVYNKNGIKLTAEDKLTTGCTVRLVENDVTVNSASVVILGDVNGNGTIDSADFLFVRRCFLGTLALEGAYLKAACVSGGSKITAADYLMVKRHYLGSYVIDQRVTG